MPPEIPFSWAQLLVKSDSRGNKLEAYEMVDTLRFKNDPDRTVYGVRVRAVDSIAEVIPRAFVGDSGTLKLRGKRSKDYTHGWWFDDGRDVVERLCKLLSSVLTLARCPELDVAVAGDFYKAPADDVPPTKWPNTKFGGLVNRAKYWSGSTQAQAEAKLVRWLTKMIEMHPSLSGLDRIVIAPSTETGLSERLGEAVARRLQVPTATANSDGNRTQPAKVGRTSAQLEPYLFTKDLSGEQVVIVDDVCRSGVTLRSIAKAARDAGATTVGGVVGARTMRAK